MSKELQIFNNNEFGEVRTLLENGKTLFCGVDVARALGYKDTTNAIKQHCRGVVKRHLTDSLGRKQSTNFVPEGDIYRLAARSALPSAERFESWIFDDVLPALRRTGSYTARPKAPAAPTVASVNTAMKMLLPIMDDMGIKPQYKISVMAKMYEPTGLEIPLIGMPAAEPYIDPRGIARKLGVLSRNDYPHDKAIGAIIKKLPIGEDEKETVPLMVNGRLQPVVRYASGVVEKVQAWLAENNYPDVIQGEKQAYTVRRRVAGVTV